MSGNYSRRKGSRVEYEIRDMFRAWGYTCHRVPASGAAQGFKGDLEVHTPEKTYVVEVKARKDEFKILYQYIWDAFITSIAPAKMCLNYPLLMQTGIPGLSICYPNLHGTEPKLSRKVASIIKKYYKNCDILVVKDDRKPPIFIKVDNGPSST